MSDPSPADPGIPPAAPAPDIGPEIDPAGSPPEMPAPDVLPDDGFGRPVDGSVMGSAADDAA